MSYNRDVITPAQRHKREAAESRRRLRTSLVLLALSAMAHLGYHAHHLLPIGVVEQIPHFSSSLLPANWIDWLQAGIATATLAGPGNVARLSLSCVQVRPAGEVVADIRDDSLFATTTFKVESEAVLNGKMAPMPTGETGRQFRRSPKSSSASLPACSVLNAENGFGPTYPRVFLTRSLLLFHYTHLLLLQPRL